MENINRGLLYSALGNLFDVTAVVFRGSNLWKISVGAKMKVKYIPYIYTYIISIIHYISVLVLSSVVKFVGNL